MQIFEFNQTRVTTDDAVTQVLSVASMWDLEDDDVVGALVTAADDCGTQFCRVFAAHFNM